MAKRPSVQEILEAARKGGAAKPAAEPEPAAAPAPVGEVEEVEASAVEPATAPSRPAAPAPGVPSPSQLGRPLTLKEKLAAARAGGAATTAPAPAPAPAAAAAPAPVETATVAEPALAVPEAGAAAVPPPAKPLGRPLTLQEKLAAVRGAASAAPAAGPTAKPATPKAAAAPAAKTAGATRVLPPLEKITDPRDLAEALRQAGAKRTKEAAAKAADAAPVKPAVAAKPAAAKPQSVLPKPAKNVAAAPAPASAPAGPTGRRGFMIGSLFISWVAVGWTAFTAGCVAFTGMMGRFMFPNVLAEPPSTMKVGEPSSYDLNDVNERFKAEGGFWIVRSNRYNGQDIIYALQTVCTHLGCPPNWLANEQKFKCPCHGSGFYITGINFEGPAPRPLERFKVTLADDGQIVVDKSQKFQQELGQWSDPDSYIAV
ncbi:MAG: ubiquinol-cytochrome c reductase iron-sulfur subunit [Isosphaeraceae bacterium]